MANPMEIVCKLQKLDFKNNEKEGEDLLQVLNKSKFDCDFVSKSKIIMIANDIRKESKREAIKKLVTSLLAKCKRIQKISESGPISVKSSQAKPKSTAAVLKNEPEKLSKLHPRRLQCRQLLADSLYSDEYDRKEMDDLAAAIESHVFEELIEVNEKYLTRIKSRIINLRDKENPELTKKVRNGTYEPARFARMSIMDMASTHVKNDLNAYKKQSIEEHKMAKPIQSHSDFYKCGRCGKRETTYTQAQTRSADEPMTTFVLCLACGKRWKHC